MKELISNLIPLLDKEVDSVLIDLLNQKLYNFNQNILSKVSVNDSELMSARQGCFVIVKNFITKILESQPKYIKIQTILSRTGGCKDCKYSKEDFYKSKWDGEIVSLGKIWVEGSDRCERCYVRCEKLEEIKNELVSDYEIWHFANNFIEENTSSDFIKLKAIINKLRRKLNGFNYKQKQESYDASKHKVHV